MGEHTGIAVIESKWFEGANTSVRGLFELVADLAADNPHAYHYEMASCEAALKEAIPRIARDRACKYLYLAMHGDRRGLQLMNGEQVTRTELRNLLERIKSERGARLTGIHMASCLFGTEEIAEKLFATSTDLVWMAGYAEEVDWIESSALDLLFFNHLADAADKYSHLTEVRKIERIASRLTDTIPGLVRDLGFGIYVRKRGTGGAKNLMAWALDWVG